VPGLLSNRIDIRMGKAQSKRNFVPGNVDYPSHAGGKVKAETKRELNTSFDTMDAIACGVEARYELITDHSRKIINETVAIAHQLGIPKGEIEKWVANRLVSDTARFSVIQSFLGELGIR